MTYAHIFSLNTRLAILPGKCTRVFPTGGSEMIVTTNRIRIVVDKNLLKRDHHDIKVHHKKGKMKVDTRYTYILSK